MLTGSHSHGQGHETTFAQLVSQRFGLPIENISIVHGDTDKVQFGMGTYGSRSGAVGMSAIFKALDKVEAKAKKIAAHLMEASEGDIEIADGEVRVAAPTRSSPGSSVALAAYTAHNLPQRHGAGAEGRRLLRPDQLHLPGRLLHLRGGDRPADRPRPRSCSSSLPTISASSSTRWWWRARCMAASRRASARRCSKRVTTIRETGQLITASYNDYTMPRADDLPSFKVSTTETLCPGNPLGMKGCGEAGAIGSPPAVINAITDALGDNTISHAGDGGERSGGLRPEGDRCARQAE